MSCKNVKTCIKKQAKTLDHSCDIRDIQKDIFEGKPPQNLNFK